jgi:membrane-associated phospholipid phosphatase
MNIWNDLSWVESLRNPLLTPFFEIITLMGYPIFLILFISFGYFYWSPSRFSRVAMMLFISGIINSFLKDYFQDPRPAIEFMLDPKVGTSYGLPSGHAQIAVTLWGLLAYELKDKWVSLGALILILAICFSRLYLGVHDIQDVSLGISVGLLILAFWHVVISSNFFKTLSRLNILICILVFQLVASVFYPTHDGHEINVWFLGAMMGWYIGSSKIILTNNKPINLCLSLFSIGGVLYAMSILTNFAANFSSTGIIDFLFVYILGILFSVIVTYLIPQLWVYFGLASDVHKS